MYRKIHTHTHCLKNSDTATISVTAGEEAELAFPFQACCEHLLRTPGRNAPLVGALPSAPAPHSEAPLVLRKQSQLAQCGKTTRGKSPCIWRLSGRHDAPHPPGQCGAVVASLRTGASPTDRPPHPPSAASGHTQSPAVADCPPAAPRKGRCSGSPAAPACGASAAAP